MKFHFWHFTLSLFFAALLVIAIRWLDVTGRLIPALPLGDLVLIVLATMRLVRLFTYDHITEFIRNWFEGHDEQSFLGTLGTLINCPWCNGLWFAFVVVFAYYASVYSWYVIVILAIAALASGLQIIMNLVGWSAELKKRQASGLPGKNVC